MNNINDNQMKEQATNEMPVQQSYMQQQPQGYNQQNYYQQRRPKLKIKFEFISYIVGILGGLLSIIMGIVVMNMEHQMGYSYGWNSSDTYSRMLYNIADDLHALSSILQFAALSILLIIGIIAICYFSAKLISAIQDGIIERIDFSDK